jgi:ribose transport system substrate-binding protein
MRVGVLYWSINIPGQVAMRKGLKADADDINKTVQAKGADLQSVLNPA